MRGNVPESRACQPVCEILSTTVPSQVWGVIIGVGNQSFAERWELVGAGTRAWEVSCLCLATVPYIQGLPSHMQLQGRAGSKPNNLQLHSTHAYTLCQYGAKY